VANHCLKGIKYGVSHCQALAGHQLRQRALFAYRGAKGSSAIFIQGALTNVNRAVETGEFLRFLAKQVPACHYFMVEPPPGISMAAAIDWRVIFPDHAAASALALALWSGYEAFIKPLHESDANPSAGLIVQIKNEQGAIDQFLVGKEITDKEVLLHRVKESARILFPKRNARGSHLEIEETRRSGYWVEIT